MLWSSCEIDFKWHFCASELGKRLNQNLYFKGMWLLDPLFVIMENWLQLICRRVYFYFFFRKQKCMCFVVLLPIFDPQSLESSMSLERENWSSIQSWKHCHYLSGNQCQLFPNVFFLLQFSKYVFFFSILIEEKEVKSYFWFNKRYFSASLNTVRNYKT